LGFIRIEFGIFNPMAPQHLIELEGIVDTGAIYSGRHERLQEVACV
jgi:hypothetical protein